MDMADHLSNFDLFVNRMKTKIIERSCKHKDDSMSFGDVKNHLIDEILEMFIVKNKSDELIIRRILLECTVDIDESIDVANMCWIIEFFVQREIK